MVPDHPAPQVGATWPGITLPRDGAHLSISPDGAELTIGLMRPHLGHTGAMKSGPTRWAWITSKHAAILAYRLTTPYGAGFPWGDVPYDWSLEHPARQGPPGQPAGQPGTPMPVVVHLVDRSTNTLTASRHLTWPARGADAIRATLARLAAQGSTTGDAERWLDDIGRRYPLPDGPERLARTRAARIWSGTTPR